MRTCTMLLLYITMLGLGRTSTSSVQIDRLIERQQQYNSYNKPIPIRPIHLHHLTTQITYHTTVKTYQVDIASQHSTPWQPSSPKASNIQDSSKMAIQHLRSRKRHSTRALSSHQRKMVRHSRHMVERSGTATQRSGQPRKRPGDTCIPQLG